MFKLMVMNLTTGHQKKPVNGLCSPSSLRSSTITPGSSSKKKLVKIYGKPYSPHCFIAGDSMIEMPQPCRDIVGQQHIFKEQVCMIGYLYKQSFRSVMYKCQNWQQEEIRIINVRTDQ